MTVSRQSSSSPSGIGQPLLCGVNSALRGRLCTKVSSSQCFHQGSVVVLGLCG